VNRVVCLIDGFNLYHSLRDLERGHGHSLRWLDLKALCSSLLHAVPGRCEVNPIQRRPSPDRATCDLQAGLSGRCAGSNHTTRVTCDLASRTAGGCCERPQTRRFRRHAPST